MPLPAPTPIANIKRVVLVASGKGGVGKSTVTANLALACAEQGLKVGVLDADIYGPSQGLLFGLPEGTRPQVEEQKYFVPVQAYGLPLMSMAFLVTDKTPMVWRGPMVSGALKQMLTQTLWPELDVLFIDMPPGTGDIQLTMSQQFKVTGAVVVSTPQKMATLDAQRAVEMFAKVDIPTLGFVENMSTHICSQCQHEESIFSTGGVAALAQDYKLPVLGQLPLNQALMQSAETGKPIVACDPAHVVSKSFLQAAKNLSIELRKQPVIEPDKSGILFKEV